MAINTTSNEVLADAFKQLSSSSLLQIAKHCDLSHELAASFNKEFKEQISFIHDEKANVLRMLSYYAYKAIEMQIKD